MSDDKHKIQLTFGLNMKISLIMSPRRSLVVNMKIMHVDLYVDQFSAMSFRLRYDNFPKAITNSRSATVRYIDARRRCGHTFQDSHSFQL